MKGDVFSITNDLSLHRGDLIFGAGENTEILRLHADGRITISKDAKPDEAAKEFLILLSELFPAWVRQPDEMP